MKTVVCYTDGSHGKHGEKQTGYGIHMYIIDDDNKKKPKLLQSTWVATEKGYKLKSSIPKEQESKIKPISKVLDFTGYRKYSHTSNTAELDAMIETFKIINDKKFEEIFLNVKKIVILADSNYALLTLKKILTLNNFTPEANAELIKVFSKVVKPIVNKNIKIEYEHVKGHSGDLGNEKADLLANIGRKLNSENSDNIMFKTIVSNVDNYYGKYVNRPGEFNNKILFNYNIDPNNKNNSINNFTIYNMLGYTGESDIGKRMNNSVYINYLTKEPNKIIDMIIDLIESLLGDDIKPYVIHLDVLFNKIIYKNIELYGKDYFIVKNKVYPIIETIDGFKIANVIYPEALSYMSFDIIELNLKKISKFLANDKSIKSIDITDKLFTLDKKSKPILIPDIKNDKYIIELDISKNINFKHKLKLNLGLDLPKRNTLKKLENYKVYLIIENNDTYFKYKTLLIKDNDNYIFIDNHYTNTIYNKNKIRKTK